MFKIYSKGCEYALRALTQITLDVKDEVFLAKQLCAKAKVPESSTRKVFQKLVRVKILSAIPGPNGGYRLAKDPSKISLFSLIVAIDGEDVFEKCVMGFPECGKQNLCPVHNTWKRMKKSMLKEMKEKTLAELMAAARKK